MAWTPKMSAATYAGAKARALAITQELQQRDEALRELLSYLSAEAEKKAHSQATAYRRNAYADAAGRLLKILDGES
jgi:hypothetical protein